MLAEEIIATPTAERREALFSRLCQFLNSAQCIWLGPKVLRLLICAHMNDPAGFDWRRVNVRAQVYEHAIARRDFDDTLCAAISFGTGWSVRVAKETSPRKGNPDSPG